MKDRKPQICTYIYSSDEKSDKFPIISVQIKINARIVNGMDANQYTFEYLIMISSFKMINWLV